MKEFLPTQQEPTASPLQGKHLGIPDLALVILAVLAMVGRTPVGGLGQYGWDVITSDNVELPSLTAYFSTGHIPAAAKWLSDMPDRPNVLPDVANADHFPEPYRTAATKIFADEQLPQLTKDQLALLTDTVEKDRLLARLDQLWSGDPEAALEVLTIGEEQRNRAIERARAAGQASANLYANHRRYLPNNAAIDADRLVEGTLSMAMVLNIYWPLEIPHRVTSPYGDRIHPIMKKRMHHNGVDLGVPIGTPVHSIQAGTISVVNEDDRSGKYIVIDHGHGVRSAYCHLDQMPMPVGTTLKRGEVFSYSGNSGRSTGPHLHFVVRVSGKAVDPMKFGAPPPKT
ncbi:MAG: M23 family metallopeptidase [Proteobacteria bacterium]|jgi:murein DD-endopeptidase MepM/ murein hydrolase activator NlpD|nr:M23 family metallopeptidase [Pseudomonadota bacterium]